MTETTNGAILAWLVVAVIIALILLVALLGMTFAYWCASKSLHQVQNRLDSYAGIDPYTATKNTHDSATLARYRRVLNSSGGGIGKRINECREIAEAVYKNAPDLYKTEQGLIYWLEATDQILVSLFEIDREWFEPNQARCAEYRSALIYQDIHDWSGLPPPRGCVITSSGIIFHE